jgi:hypothetical protein
MAYWAIRVTWCGSMIVPSMSAKNAPRPMKCIRANAYAASEQDTMLPITTPVHTRSEFSR